MFEGGVCKLAVVVVTGQDVQGGNPLDFSDPAVQAQMDESLQLFRDNEYVRGDTMSSWWEEMKTGGVSPGVRLVCMHVSRNNTSCHISFS